MTEEKIYDRLAKVLRLTKSPNEHEAEAAAEMLQKLLTQHNLSVADLEGRGQKSPGVRKEAHDLGKAAFKWKLSLAEAVAAHYFCHALVDYRLKTVAFIGRPDNVESLQLLYGWMMEQVKEMARVRRKAHQEETGEHIDPLRYQVAFGEGAVDHLRVRLQDLRKRREGEAKRNSEAKRHVALVLHHKSEISDWLEGEGLSRIDGRRTQSEQEWYDYLELQRAERKKEAAEKEAMRATAEKTGVWEGFWKAYPEEHPDRVAERDAEREEEQKREIRNAKRRKQWWERADRDGPKVDERKEDQSYTANAHGRVAATKVNLEPFLKDGKPKSKGRLG